METTRCATSLLSLTVCKTDVHLTNSKAKHIWFCPDENLTYEEAVIEIESFMNEILESIPWLVRLEIQHDGTLRTRWCHTIPKACTQPVKCYLINNNHDKPFEDFYNSDNKTIKGMLDAENTLVIVCTVKKPKNKLYRQKFFCLSTCNEKPTYVNPSAEALVLILGILKSDADFLFDAEQFYHAISELTIPYIDKMRDNTYDLETRQVYVRYKHDHV